MLKKDVRSSVGGVAHAANGDVLYVPVQSAVLNSESEVREYKSFVPDQEDISNSFAFHISKRTNMKLLVRYMFFRFLC